MEVLLHIAMHRALGGGERLEHLVVALLACTQWREKHLHSGEKLEHLAKIVEGGGLLELLLNTSCCHLFQAAAGNSKIKF